MADEHYAGDTASGNNKKALRVLIADDHEMVRVAMRYALAGLADGIEWRDAADVGQAQSILAQDNAIDLALIDLNMPGSDGIDWIRALRQSHPTLPLLVMSASEDPATVRALIELGVAGFIPKSDSSAVILQAVRLVLAGGTYAPLRLLTRDTARVAPGASAAHAASTVPTVAGLTARQQEVLALLARGLPNKLIARELGLSESTVKVHLLAIYRVLSVRNRTEAVVAAQAFVAVESRR